MYCNTPQVNQLTALLIAHNIRHIVHCPGSRNAILGHNFHESEAFFTLHPITDERSAAFVALGMVLATQEPVAVCVTSGSALLNCIPAVAEAYYRQLPLLIISADRPQSWIGQFDGQTLPQAGALQPYCSTFNLCEPHTNEDVWHNNRCINEAIISLTQAAGGPAHINVPISEPMFNFTTTQLPVERKITSYHQPNQRPLPHSIIEMIAQAQLPALVIGQYEKGDIRNETELIDNQQQMLVLSEIISDVTGNFRLNAFDTLNTETNLCPDVVVQIGGNFVHKKFKTLLRKTNCRVVRISENNPIADTFCHLEAHVIASPQTALAQLCQELPCKKTKVKQAQHRLDCIWNDIKQSLNNKKAESSHTIHHTLCTLRQQLAHHSSYTLHLANSTTVRAASNVFESGSIPIFCNRGTNGIEGSLSTAVGYALKMWGLCIAIIGDLSFFYDANALWNTQLPPNLRILLLNNHHGGIFDQLPGLSSSPACDTFIAAGHQSFKAQGIALSFNLGYHQANNTSNLSTIMQQWLAKADKAQILEVEVE